MYSSICSCIYASAYMNMQVLYHAFTSSGDLHSRSSGPTLITKALAAQDPLFDMAPWLHFLHSVKSRV